MDNIVVCRNATLNGLTSVVTMQQFVGADRGVYTVYVGGTFGGAAVKIQLSPDGDLWVDLPNGSFTSATAVNVDLSAAYLRASLSNVSGTTSVSVILGF